MVNKKLALVFPGQGSQAIGMLHEMAARYPLVTQTFAEASDALGYDLWKIVQQGPKEQLNQTAVTQPAILTASVALWRVWQACSLIKPVVLAGHSLGEYSALVCAGALPFPAAVTLVAQRGQYMQSAVPPGAGMMAAIVGLSTEQVMEICQAAAQGEVVAPANINAPEQIVIAGQTSAVVRAIAAAQAAGAKLVKKLEVSVPSHCALMQQAARALAETLRAARWQLPEIPVVQNADAGVHTDLLAIQEALCRQLFYPVRWVESILTAARDYTVDMIIECGPGKVLTGLNKRIVQLPAFAIAEPAMLDTVLDEVSQHV